MAGKGKAYRGGIRGASEGGENHHPKRTGNGDFHRTAKKNHPMNYTDLRVMRGGIRF